MPIYEVHHSYPLKGSQKQELATNITKLHSTTFKTPSFFVHVIFNSHDAHEHNYFVAGQPRLTSTNRIIAQVRTSPSRSKSDFDTLAASLETIWLDALNGSVIDDKQHKSFGKRPGEADLSEDKQEAQRLLMVSFYPMITAREQGMVIPEAGKEGEFFKEWRPYMVKMSEEKGLADFKEMLRELDEREDLKGLSG